MLERIVGETREELRTTRLDRAGIERRARERTASSEKHRFRAALEQGGERDARIIAEIKAASPSAGTIVSGPDVESIAAAYRDGGAAAISVVTEPRHFKGTRDWLARAANASGLPVIMKDFVVDPVQIFRGVAAGADAVLLLASILDASQLRDFIAITDELGRDALVEVHDDRELDVAIDGGARLVGVNNRNLRDFSVDLGTSERLGARIPESALRVTESGIHTRADVEQLLRSGFRAFLVGESLLRQADRAAGVRRLRGVETGA
ncbi:MAG: indole-3-glycerol phosphate synthase TrpC [Thermoanaerobaculia bacterium]|nr:indole-3-glycerol phosphate synthase TrpC [Thermoanaerobaculia bacterium]